MREWLLLLAICMCGICGVTNDRGGRAVAAMCGEMVRRGPDDEGVYVDPTSGLALGARRLSIIDPEGGHQPVPNENRSVWAVLNGEIYNHPALQKHLIERGHRLASRTDTEVLVHLYEEYGDALVHALEGMYAFAIWDGSQQRLLVARDRFGEKPLFFRQDHGQLQFASELAALAAGVPGRLALDPVAIDDYFVLGYFAGEASIASGVRQLLPGHLLRWSVGDPVVRTERYWSMPPRARSIDESDDQLAAELEELLRTSVRSRLIADVPVGVFLSGGIDSTLVTALAAQEHSGRLRSFTVSYDVGTVNEDEPARAAARILGTEHAEVVLEQTGLDHKVEELLGSIDQPNADPALLPLATVAALARQNVTVAVGGEGADELFGGYPRYRWLQRAATLDHVIPSGIRTLAARAVRDRVSSARVRRIADVLEPTDVAVRHLDWVTDQRRRAREGLYGPRLRAAAGEGALADVRRIVGNHSDGETAERFIALDLQRWLPDDVLCKADRATMFNSLEMRTPFLERNVAEFTASIPAAELLAHGGKSLLDAVLARIPGAPKVKRAKTAFRVPHSEWLRGPLRELVSDCVTGGRLVDEGWFDRAAIERIAREHTFGADHSVVLWPALALGLWLEGAGQEFAAA